MGRKEELLKGQMTEHKINEDGDNYMKNEEPILDNNLHNRAAAADEF